MLKKFLIADDYYVVRAGTTIILESLYEDIKTDYASDFAQMMIKIEEEQYDLLLLDIDMPGTLYKKMISEIRKYQPDLKILLYTSFEEDIAVQYMREGANGYLSKLADESEIKRTITSVMETGFHYSSGIFNKIIEKRLYKNPIEKLSDREYEIFNLLIIGYGNSEICNKFDLSKSTVSTYKNRIFKKLNVKTIFEMMELKKNIH